MEAEIKDIHKKLDKILAFMETLSPKKEVLPQKSPYFILKGSALLEECHLLQFDGLSEPNPGESTAGAVLFSPERKPVFERGTYMGHATNNQAEYTGLLIGLNGAIRFGVKNLLIEGDSQLVIFQTEGKWKVANETLKTIHTEIMTLLEQFDFVGIRHIPREQNAHADKITNDVIYSKKSFFIIPQVF